MNVLISNDDGIYASGIKALVEGLDPKIKKVVVAPADQKSASSHSISLGQKLRVQEFIAGNVLHYAVHGTPVDCVKFAISEVKNFIPDLILSGINQGANTGVSVYYSGTISAAREGVINRVPAVALSLCSRDSTDFRASVVIANKIVEAYAQGIFPKHVLLNVNIPPGFPDDIKGIRITKQADSRFIEEFVTEKIKKDERIYTLAGEIELMDPDGTSDEEAVSEGYISITPLKLDLTDYSVIKYLEETLL